MKLSPIECPVYQWQPPKCIFGGCQWIKWCKFCRGTRICTSLTFSPVYESITNNFFSQEDKRVRKTMVDAWTSFSKIGNPGMGWTTSVLNSDQQYWNISYPTVTMEGSPKIRDRMKIWNEVCLDNDKC